MPNASITERLRQVTKRDVPGIAVAIAGPEGLRETAAAGYADLAAREPASADMVRDAARFLQMHLCDGELDGTRILPAESAAAMRHITVTGKRYDLGLGWFRPASQRDADPCSWSTSAAAADSST